MLRLSQEPELAARVGAVYTWGQPRAGDAAFARIFTTAYGDRTFRIRNAGDIVGPLCPPAPPPPLRLSIQPLITQRLVIQ